tara:strand:+ start:2027 stop:2197 length:171 start_codon:yes stop_codon:yes gene_type:complete
MIIKHLLIKEKRNNTSKINSKINIRHKLIRDILGDGHLDQPPYQKLINNINKQLNN